MQLAGEGGRGRRQSPVPGQTQDSVSRESPTSSKLGALEACCTGDAVPQRTDCAISLDGKPTTCNNDSLSQ